MMRMMILVIRMRMMMTTTTTQCYSSLVMSLMRRMKKHLRRLNWARRDPLILQPKLLFLLKRQKQLLLKRQMVRRVFIQQLRILPRRLERLLLIVINPRHRPRNLPANTLANLAARVSAQKLDFSLTQRPNTVAIKYWVT